MDAKKKAQETVHTYQQTLIDLSHRIHDHPELGFAEEQASRWITEVLADARTIAQVSIGLLRQQLPSTIRISGIVTDEGEVANIIPSHAAYEILRCTQNDKDERRVTYGLLLRKEHALHLGIQLSGMHAHLTPDTALFVSTKWRLGMYAVAGVHGQHTCTHALYHA